MKKDSSTNAKINNNRKLEHIDVALSNSAVDRHGQYFDQVKLIHRALPEIDYQAVDSSTNFLNHKLSFPLLISAMTGGCDKKLFEINKNLALAAEHCNVAMTVGSQRVSFDCDAAKKSFQLREFAPQALLFANLGAVQLNYGFTIKECQQAVDQLCADALVLHLNPLQEIIQTGGNTDFSNLIEKISAVRDQLTVPVILKEVGSGFSPADARLARQYGLNVIDIAGSGGTSWSLVEHVRSHEDTEEGLGKTFQDWGIPTPAALKILRAEDSELTLIASGGIRNGVDIAKATILGAELCGMALPFLEPALDSAEKVIEQIEKVKKEFIAAMFLLGCSRYEQLHGNTDLLLED